VSRTPHAPRDPLTRALTRPLWDRRYTRVQGGCGLLLLAIIAAPCLALQKECAPSAPSHTVPAPALATRGSVHTARTSACGTADARPAAVSEADWSSYSCVSRASAAERWSACLARDGYAAVGEGCPGAQRCCPHIVISADNTPVAAPSSGPRLWSCRCDRAGLDGELRTICRTTRTACERDGREAGQITISSCRPLATPGRPEQALGGSWEPLSAPGWESRGACLLDAEAHVFEH